MAGKKRIVATCCEKGRWIVYYRTSQEWIWSTSAYFDGASGLAEVPVTRCPYCGDALPDAEEPK